jgi:arylsulfatase A-like enzyme
MLDDLGRLNQLKLDETGDPEIATRIAQYELAYRMQTSVPELTDISREPKHILELYGPDARKPGTFAANCLLARRLAERGVRFIQLFHRGWDQHTNLPKQITGQCRDTDQASAALIKDLKQRGLLEDTLVVWGGEFGRTVYCQGKLTANDYGRDHHPRCFTIWLAGGGMKPGFAYGETDDYSYNITRDPVHVHDLHATILHCLGIDHTRLTYKFQGRHHRLTDVHGKVVRDILA